MIDKSAIGRELPGQTLLVTRSRLRHFARAIGQTDRVYVDVETARAQGHADLPVPPTFLFGIDLEAEDPFAVYTDIGIDLGRLLHGEQRFTYQGVAHAGDELSTTGVISDIYSKRGGQLEFVIRTTSVRNQRDDLVAEMVTTLIVRNPEDHDHEEESG